MLYKHSCDLCIDLLQIAMGILEVPPHVSKVHASRRVFQLLTERESTLPIVHHLLYDDITDKDELILRAGSGELILTTIKGFYIKIIHLLKR
jgi:hypothetical protein